jgi:hypothetical protein
MNREQMIETLTTFELEGLNENFDKHNLSAVVEFFISGGFNNWTDEQLKAKFESIWGDDE